jgi:hypothetical protein
MKLRILAFSFFALLMSCAKTEDINAENSDDLKLSLLAADIENFTQDKACTGSDCRAMAMGSKPCGGPTKYIIYALSKVDEKVLAEKVKNYTDLQKEINLKYNRVSDCSFLMPPSVDCINGVCTAK